MFLACGVGAFVAAIFHVMTHAFFKALLFLGSGSVIHGMHHEQDMRRMGGLKKYMPVTFATMLTGWLAICGVPIFAGFFSKDEILWKTFDTKVFGEHSVVGPVLWGVGALTALLTAVYMTRLMVMTFWGGERFREAHAGGQADEAHAHAHDEGDKPHDARLASAGDRPHHRPGEAVDSHGHHAAREGGTSSAAHAFDDEEEHDSQHHHGPVEPHESPWVMTVPLVILAVPYALSSLVGFHDDVNVFEHTLEPAVYHAESAAAPAAAGHGAAAPAGGHSSASPESVGEGRVAETAHGAAHDPAHVAQERLFTGLSVLVAFAGIALGWVWFKRRPLYEMPRILEEKYYVDEAYDAAVVNPLKVGSREGLWRFFDVGVIDGLVNGVARLMSGAGSALRYLQPGFVRSYAAIILLGALFVVGYFAYNFYQLYR
jgi:NADH-quinone oxidoreductase subunit L